MRQSKDEAKGAKAKVLIVDDSMIVRVLVGTCLKQAGYDVAEANDGITALRHLGAGGFDVVVTDLNMPEMGGLAMLAEIKEQALGPEVIILTGSHAQDVDSAVHALRLGAHDYLTKPLKSPDQIVFTVQRALEKKRLRDENARLLKELQTLSLTDALTGLPNRRSFDEALRHETARARRHGHTLSVIMLDIDHFKRVNDTHGHSGGDRALEHFASTASRTLRRGDVLYRVGGEEFAALLPETSAAGALEASARMLGTLASNPLVIEGVSLRLTASAGVACTNGIEDGLDVVGEADAALYEAKRGGRNRVFLPVGRMTQHAAAAC